MAKKYGVAILGAGWVAGEYVKAFRDHPLTEVAGIYNRTPGKAEKLMKQYGVEGREYKSEDELFNDDRVKIVVSCTPPDVRPAHIERAAMLGLGISAQPAFDAAWGFPGALYERRVGPDRAWAMNPIRTSST